MIDKIMLVIGYFFGIVALIGIVLRILGLIGKYIRNVIMTNTLMFEYLIHRKKFKIWLDENKSKKN